MPPAAAAITRQRQHQHPIAMNDEEVKKAHRWFAVECNNGAWGLTSKDKRTGDEDREMLLSACAAAFHWSKVGAPINQARAEILLAHVCSLLGKGEEALSYAQRCLDYFETNPGEDWDLAFAHSEMALASAAAGDQERHAKHYALAESQGKAIKDDEDRRVFQQEFARIPKPLSRVGR